jgi:hypothetical protein
MSRAPSEALLTEFTDQFLAASLTPQQCEQTGTNWNLLTINRDLRLCAIQHCGRLLKFYTKGQPKFQLLENILCILTCLDAQMDMKHQFQEARAQQIAKTEDIKSKEQPKAAEEDQEDAVIV